jgi:hypothetical protein
VRKPQPDRRTVFVVLFLLLAIGLVLAGLYRGPTASAATLPIGRSTGLLASGWSPASGATGVALDVTVSVQFNKDLAARAINSNTFYLQRADDAAHIAATLGYSSVTDTATLKPTSDLLPGTTYRATITSSIQDKDGSNLANAGSWSFTTTAGRPNVTQLVPAPGAVGVPLTQTLSATFDRDMDAATITSATFYIQKSGGTPLPAAVIYDRATRTAILRPLAGLEAGATYQVTLSNAIKGANGLTLAAAPVVWGFDTMAVAPTVTSKVPTAAATGVPVGQVVSATFDKDMDATTITSATFYIQKPGGSPLPAAVAYNAATRTATLDPLADLETNTTYHVTLANAVKGADSQTLTGAPVVWSFVTAGGTSSFTDVIPGVTPYSTAIAALATDNIITGYPDGTFRPNDPVLRQQFAKMIVLALDLTVTGNEVCPFTDVALQIGYDPFYPSKYVAVCAAQGIAQGITPTIFAPYAIITHQQLITMIARAADLSAPPVSYTPAFTASQFSLPSHYENARKADYAGLLNGLLGIGPSYDFLAGSTRGECAQLLYNLMVLVTT